VSRAAAQARLYHAEMDLRGRTIAITGASSGIGLACAEVFARAGAAVVLGARRTALLEEAVSRLRSAGGRAEAVTMDVTSEEDSRRLVARARQAFGGLDAIVCNAGFGYYGTVEETPPDIMRRMMDVNFLGSYYAARAALPHFRQQGHGHLIFVSSIVGRRGIAQMSGYTASKAAQVGFAESLRSEFAGSRIHVSIVYPVSTETDFRAAMARDYGHRVAGLGPKQPAAHVAEAIADCLRRPRPEVYPHRLSKMLAVVNTIAPGFTDAFVRRYGRRRTISRV
jgi:NAD(P)-dependent dehydrogenase (short-subunit alcohol dehydrogenase family)